MVESGKDAGPRFDSVPGEIIRGVFKVVITVIEKLLDRWLVLGITLLVVVGHLGYVWLLPSEARAGNELLGNLSKSVKEIVENSGFCLVGWMLLVILITISVPVALLSYRRITDQGSELSALRNAEDPGRITSHDPKVYTQKGKSSIKNNGGTDG